MNESLELKMLKILERIHNGERNFSPDNNDVQGISDFQAIAKCIISAHNRGYLKDIKHWKSYHKNDYGSILHIIVIGGLTFEGEQFLSIQAEFKSNVYQNQRLIKKHEMLKEKWDLINEKINRLEREKIFETRPEEKMRLTNHIQEAKRERDEIETEMMYIENQLEST